MGQRDTETHYQQTAKEAEFNGNQMQRHLDTTRSWTLLVFHRAVSRARWIGLEGRTTLLILAFALLLLKYNHKRSNKTHVVTRDVEPACIVFYIPNIAGSVSVMLCAQM